MRRPQYIPVGVAHIGWKVTIFHNPSLYLCFVHGSILSDKLPDFVDEFMMVKRHTRMIILFCHVLLLPDGAGVVCE